MDNRKTIGHLRQDHLAALLGYTPEQAAKYTYNDLVYQYTQAERIEEADQGSFPNTLIGGLSPEELGSMQATLDDFQRGTSAFLQGISVTDAAVAISVRDGESNTAVTEVATDAATLVLNTRPKKFGPLAMPPGFPKLPCTFYRDGKGVIQHDFDFAARRNVGTKVHIAANGNDATGTGASDAPFRTIKKAWNVVVAGADPVYEIISTGISMFTRDEVSTAESPTLTGKKVTFRSEDAWSAFGYNPAKRPLITTNASYVWTLDGAGTYKTARSGIAGVLDAGSRDHNGLPTPIALVSSLAACQATLGSYYTDGISVWVHRNDGQMPTQSSTVVTIGVSFFEPTLVGGASLFLEGFIFCGWMNGNGLRVQGAVTSTVDEIIINRCGFVGTSGDGFRSYRVAKTYVFDAQSAYEQRDAFNYSYEGMSWAHVRANCLAIEYNCTGYKIGHRDIGGGSNNTSTGHNGIPILRIGHVGYENTGATVIDVNGCFSVLYDCHVRTPINPPTMGYGDGTAYMFSSGTLNEDGEVWMYDCTADDCAVALSVGSSTVANVFRFTRPPNAAIEGAGTINMVG